MALALVVTACLAIGLPMAAWFVERRHQARYARTVDGLGPPTDGADQWLIERHRLPALRRRQVRHAVIFGRALRDKTDRAAVRDLATATMTGQVRLGRGVRVGLRVLLADAVLLVAAGALITTWLSPAGIIPALIGAWNAVIAITGMRTVRGGAERALPRNQ